MVNIFNVLVAVVASVIFLLIVLQIAGNVKATYLVNDAKLRACSELKNKLCCTPTANIPLCSENDLKSVIINGFDADKDGSEDPGTSDTEDNLWTLCKNYYNITTAEACRKECGCK
ncbi:MAG: hypothetical protein QW751_01585 [Candidatus Aenigmatarchaeota archaeon]|nr:hypothetical protein [Candidatus Aenigmarchaeota archaeon]